MSPLDVRGTLVLPLEWRRACRGYSLLSSPDEQPSWQIGVLQSRLLSFCGKLLFIICSSLKTPLRGPSGAITWAPRGNHVGPLGQSRGPLGEIRIRNSRESGKRKGSRLTFRTSSASIWLMSKWLISILLREREQLRASSARLGDRFACACMLSHV